MNDIKATDLLSDEDLLDCLLSRFDCAIFIGDKIFDSERNNSMFELKGNYYAKLGLAHTLCDIVAEQRPSFDGLDD